MRLHRRRQLLEVPGLISMTHRELHVTFTDGREVIVQTERDDTHGRRWIDEGAAEWLARTDVLAARSVQVDRVAMTGRKTYR